MSHLRRDYQLENLARELLQRARAYNTATVISVVWNTRMRTTAGVADYRKKTIFLNPKIQEVAPDEVQRTLRHELAHFLADERSGRRRIEPHGREWQQACRDLGIPNEARCHNMPLQPRREMARKYFYRCRACGNQLERVRKIRRAMACLSCCRKHSGGHYDERFRFVPSEPRPQIAA